MQKASSLKKMKNNQNNEVFDHQSSIINPWKSVEEVENAKDRRFKEERSS
jgi:hypothetical protein